LTAFDCLLQERVDLCRIYLADRSAPQLTIAVLGPRLTAPEPAAGARRPVLEVATRTARPGPGAARGPAEPGTTDSVLGPRVIYGDGCGRHRTVFGRSSDHENGFACLEVSGRQLIGPRDPGPFVDRDAQRAALRADRDESVANRRYRAGEDVPRDTRRRHLEQARGRGGWGRGRGR